MSEDTGLIASGRHPVNIGHLVMGIAFLGLVGVWALIEGDLVGGGDVRWLMPIPWVLAGLAGVLAITLPSRRNRTDRPADPYGSGQTGRVGEDDGTPR